MKRADHDVLVLPYGSAFPARGVARDPGLRAARAAASWFSGARRFTSPCAARATAYVLGSRQPTYARELLIGPAQEIDVTAFAGPRTSVVVEGSGWTRPLPEPRRTWALTVRLTSVKDMPGEDGSGRARATAS